MNQLPTCLGLTEEDVKKMLACSVHLGDTHLDSGMSRYVTGRNEVGAHIIDIRKTWEKLVLAARAIVPYEVPSDIVVLGLNRSFATPIAQRAVLKFSKYVGSKSIAGRFTPGTFTNQQQNNYLEPHVLIVSDPLKDYQPILEASYVNLPVIALANTNANLRGVDIVIPCNTESKHSIALIYWMLAREILRLRGKLARNQEWDVMVDMFIYREPEEIEAEQEEAVDTPAWTEDAGNEWDAGNANDWHGSAPVSAIEGEDSEWTAEGSSGWGEANDAAPAATGAAAGGEPNWENENEGWDA